MVKIISSPRYEIGVTGTDLLSLGELGGGGLILKKKNNVFSTYEGEIGSY